MFLKNIINLLLNFLGRIIIVRTKIIIRTWKITINLKNEIRFWRIKL